MLGENHFRVLGLEIFRWVSRHFVDKGASYEKTTIGRISRYLQVPGSRIFIARRAFDYRVAKVSGEKNDCYVTARRSSYPQWV